MTNDRNMNYFTGMHKLLKRFSAPTLVMMIGVTITSHVSQAQLISDSVLIEGNYRSFHFNKSASPSAGRSLFFIMHGSGGNGRQMINGAAKIEAMSERENLLIVYPDGYKKYWNECRLVATSAANQENVNEAAFFDSMIHYFSRRYEVNERHVFATGMSGGGHMAYKLALTMPGKISAIAAIVANLPDSANMDCVASGIPVPVMIINGTDDPVNPFNGGEVKVTGARLGTVRSTEATFKYWAQLAGYKGKPKTTLLPDVDPTDGKTIVRSSYRKRGKPSVELLTVNNGKHDYPKDIDVYLEAWNFFKKELRIPTPVK